MGSTCEARRAGANVASPAMTRSGNAMPTYASGLTRSKEAMKMLAEVRGAAGEIAHQQPNRNSRQAELRALFHNHVDHRETIRADCHANADLTRASTHRIGDQAVKPHNGQNQTHEAQLPYDLREHANSQVNRT